MKKNIVISDDEDSEDIQPKRRAQPKKPIDKSLAAMMDMDDGEFFSDIDRPRL